MIQSLYKPFGKFLPFEFSDWGQTKFGSLEIMLTRKPCEPCSNFRALHDLNFDAMDAGFLATDGIYES